MKKLWIDDVRTPPDDTWVWVKNSSDAVDWLINNDPDLVSFDHDLGGADTAMKVTYYVEIWAHNGLIQRFDWQIHSANPVGRKNLEAAMNSAERFWKEKLDKETKD